MKKYSIIGAPTALGTVYPGLEKAPVFLRSLGLIDALKQAGNEVVDEGDLPTEYWRPDINNPDAQNIGLIADYALQVADRVDNIVQSDNVPIVIGGDCTITLGVVTGLLRHLDDLGTFYVDGHTDMATPDVNGGAQTIIGGVLDGMGMGHMLALDGTREELSRMANRYPMLKPEQVILFGVNRAAMIPGDADSVDRLNICCFEVTRHEGSIKVMAQEALAHLENRVQHFVFHFDVDAICFNDFPIAHLPITTRHVGLTYEQAMEVVEVVAASEQCTAIVLTEINADFTGEERGRQFINGIAQALGAICGKT